MSFIFEKKCPGSSLETRSEGPGISKYGVWIFYFGICIKDIVGLGWQATLWSMQERL